MMHRILPLWIVAACLGMASAVATADTFMLAPGVAGDATEKAHAGWVRISDLDWAVTAMTSYTHGGGVSVGKPNPSAIKLIRASGPWSTEFLRKITLGQAFTQIVIVHVASDGRPSYRATLDGLFITRYGIGSTAKTPLPQDEVEAVFKTVKMEFYIPYGADGLVKSANLTWNTTTGVVN